MEYSTGGLSGRLCGTVVNYFIVLDAPSSLGNQDVSAGLGRSSDCTGAGVHGHRGKSTAILT